MYKKDKILCAIIFSLSFGINYFLKLKSVNMASDILTIISILLGFYISAISTLFGSEIMHEYANVQDKKIPSQTKLGTLIKYFKNSVNIAFFTIIIALICLLFKGKDYLKEYHIKELASAVLTSSTFLSLFLFLLLMKVFFALFYNESNKIKK